MKKLQIFWYLFFSASSFLHSSQNCSNNEPITLFCHGLGGHRKERITLIREQVIHEPTDSFSMSNYQATCPLGYGSDLQALQDAMQEDKQYILYGRSRGGFTALNHFISNQPSNVQALILDAAPCDMLNIVDEYQYKCGIFLFWTQRHKEWIMRQFYPQYPKNSVPPLEKIHLIQDEKIKDVPIFIGHSHADRRVNIQSAFQNYKTLKQHGFKNVYLHELEKASHHHNSKDQGYKKALQSFYKHHDFTHDSNLATLNDQELQALQPSLDVIEQKISDNQWKLRKQAIFNISIATILGLYLIHKK